MENQGLEYLIAIEKAIEFIKKLSKDEIDNLAIGITEFNIISKSVDFKEELQVDTSNSGGKSRRGRRTSYYEGGSTKKESKIKSGKKKEANKKEKDGYITQTFEKVENEELNEFDIYIKELSKFRDKETAINYLVDNKLTVTKLKILAKKLSIHIKSKAKKIDIIEDVVDGIVGSRLRLEELRKY